MIAGFWHTNFFPLDFWTELFWQRAVSWTAVSKVTSDWEEVSAAESTWAGATLPESPWSGITLPESEWEEQEKAGLPAWSKQEMADATWKKKENVVVTGTPTPDCTGVYEAKASEGGKSAYMLPDESYKITWIASLDKWYISKKGTLFYTAIWSKSGGIEGTYTSDDHGSAVVAYQKSTWSEVSGSDTEWSEE